MNTREKSFDQFYLQISTTLEAVEALRKQIARRIIQLRWGVFITLLLLVIATVVFPNFLLLFGLAWALVYFVTRKYYVLENISRVYVPKFKQEVIFPMLDYFYEDAVYIPNQRMNRNVLNKSLLFHHYVYRHHGEDYFSCRIGNTTVSSSEIQNDSSEFFDGVFIAVRFNKKFKTKTIVLPRQRDSLFRKLKLNVYGDMVNATYVELENPLFKRDFVVIAEDQVESRYKLTPGLMDRMLKYKKRFDDTVSFSFVDNYLYVAIQSRFDFFEPPVFKPVNRYEFVRKNYQYFQVLTGIVEDLDLNTRIWA